MTAPAAFKATFSDFRLVKGRKVAQIVVEVPIEEADNALKALGGIPRPDLERWVAVARLSPGAFIPKSEALASADGEGATPQKQPTPAPGETKGGWYALKPSARAAILCKDGDFLMWANSTWRLQMLLSELPDWLRNRVDVHSRAQLDPDHAQHRPDALKRYLRIEGQYRVDSGQETAPR
jgi:hypothetical protein